MPVLDFQAGDALRVADGPTTPVAASTEGGSSSATAEWRKLQNSIASLQALGVLKEKPPDKKQRRQSLPAVTTFGQLEAEREEEATGEEGLRSMGTAQLVAPSTPLAPTRSMKLPDASKFVKFFEQSAANEPVRRQNGRRWTVVANQVPTFAAPPSTPKNTGMRGDRNRNSVTLDGLPSQQRVTTAPPRARHSTSSFNGMVQGNVTAGSDDSDSSEEEMQDKKGKTWSGWYKISASQKEEAEVKEDTQRKSFDLSQLVANPIPLKDPQVAEAAELWEKIRAEKTASEEAHEQFMQSLPQGMSKFAAILTNRFGSLERAFQHFDYNHKGKVTRGQFQTTLATIRLDTEEVVGLPNKKVFRQISSVGGKASLEITLEQWMLFFDSHLSGTAAEFLLTEDRGSQAPKRWQQMRKLPIKALKSILESGIYTLQEDGVEFSQEFSQEWQGGPEGRREGKRTSRDEDGMEGDAGQLDHDSTARATHHHAAPADGASTSLSGAGAGGSAGGSAAADGDGNGTGHEGGEVDELGALEGKRFEELTSIHGDASRMENWKENRQISTSSSNASEDELSTLQPKRLLGAHSGVDGRKVDRSKVMRAFKQRDDKAVAELNEDELQALAEQVQLQQEIEELDLSNIDAFAYVLLAKLGSFKRAFRWFDFNCTRKITNVTWDTGILLLHVDTESLTGLKPGQIFYRMDVVLDPNSPDGMITRKKWKAFFAGFQPPPELQKLLDEGKTLRQRAAAKRKQYHRRGSLFRGDRGGRLKVKGDDVGFDEDEKAEQERAERLAEEKDSFRSWVESEMASIADGTFKEYSDATFRGGAESLLTPYERRRVMLEIAQAYGLYTLMTKGTGRMPPRVRNSLERAPGITESDLVPPPGCLKVYNMTSFSRDMSAKLDGISSGGRLPLGQEFSASEKAVIHLLALDRELVVVQERWGRGERLVIHDTGSFAKGLSAKLDALDGGGSTTISTQKLTNIEMKLVHAQAAQKGLRVRTALDENGDEVLKAALEAAKASLEQQGLATLAGEAADGLSGLPPTLEGDQECATASRSGTDAMSLSHSRGHSSASDGAPGDPDSLQSAKDVFDHQGASATGDGTSSYTPAPSSSALISQAFDFYASGQHGSERTFLRFVDLKEFSGDLRDAMPKKRRLAFHEFQAILEMCFDDTAQLQTNLGIRVGSGLTLQFFQVFIQKAMNRLGLQIASVLFTVLNEYT